MSVSVSLPATTRRRSRAESDNTIGSNQPPSIGIVALTYQPTYLPAYLPTYMTDTLRWHTLINSAIHSVNASFSLFHVSRPFHAFSFSEQRVLQSLFRSHSFPPPSPAVLCRELIALSICFCTVSLCLIVTLSRLCFCADSRSRDRIDASSANCISIPVHRVKLHLRLVTLNQATSDFRPFYS